MFFYVFSYHLYLRITYNHFPQFHETIYCNLFGHID